MILLLIVLFATPYEPHTVDIPPRCSTFVYPNPSPKDTGLVILRVLVDEKGTPDSMEVWFATDSLLAKEAIKMAKRLRFEPAMLKGMKVPCWTLLTIPFPGDRSNQKGSLK